MHLQGTGTAGIGIQILQAGAVYIEDCDIQNFSGKGIDFEPTNAGSKLFVSTTNVLNNANGGVLIKPNLVTATAALDTVTANGNSFGIEVDDNATVTVSNSQASGNLHDGIAAVSTSQNVAISLEKDVISGNVWNGVDFPNVCQSQRVT